MSTYKYRFESPFSSSISLSDSSRCPLRSTEPATSPHYFKSRKPADPVAAALSDAGYTLISGIWISPTDGKQHQVSRTIVPRQDGRR